MSVAGENVFVGNSVGPDPQQQMQMMQWRREQGPDTPECNDFKAALADIVAGTYPTRYRWSDFVKVCNDHPVGAQQWFAAAPRDVRLVEQEN